MDGVWLWDEIDKDFSTTITPDTEGYRNFAQWQHTSGVTQRLHLRILHWITLENYEAGLESSPAYERLLRMRARRGDQKAYRRWLRQKPHAV